MLYEVNNTSEPPDEKKNLSEIMPPEYQEFLPLF